MNWVTLQQFSERVWADALEGGYDQHVIVAFRVDAFGTLTIEHAPPPGDALVASVVSGGDPPKATGQCREPQKPER